MRGCTHYIHPPSGRNQSIRSITQSHLERADVGRFELINSNSESTANHHFLSSSCFFFFVLLLYDDDDFLPPLSKSYCYGTSRQDELRFPYYISGLDSFGWYNSG